MQTRSESLTSPKRVVVVGAGGNIGSHLVSHLARMSGLDCITLIDRDVYELANLRSQDITPGDVGKFKAHVQALKLRRINRAIQVNAVAEAVERVPLGRLRAAAILACLDSRIARQHVNQFAWRLGVPLIDAGVEPGSLLARINVYVPGPEHPCLECAWDDRDYQALEQTYACRGATTSAPPTNAPSSLGALAASLQAIECQKILSGHHGLVAVSRQVLVDASHHRHFVTAFRRNSNCRFAGHEVWRIEKLDHSPREMTVADALTLGRRNGSGVLRIEGKPFATRLTCPSCGEGRRIFALECSLGRSKRRCGRCGSRTVANGFDLLEELDGSTLKTAVRNRSLWSLGLRSAEIFTIRHDDAELHYELSG
ncbi:MAG TPA: ThiF family adenylyltransferase [Blastocatellia bacterium]|nr:ThiF family adenylyltransferase [Blastocatellia bacterium]